MGVKNIPKDMVETLMNFDCTKSGKKRPDFLSVKKHALKNISKLISMRPKKELVIDEEFGPGKNPA